MEFKQIQELIKAINKSNISELSIQDGEFQITIKQAQATAEMQYMSFQQMPQQQMLQHQQMPQQLHHGGPGGHAAPAPVTAAEAAELKGTPVKSPMIGTFYRSSSPDKPAFVNVGDEIRAGQVLCIIEAMKLFNEIESEVSGRIIKVLVDDASPVEYDQPLFLVEPV